jgi:uncharacterized protein YggT (Ycf19 family)
MRRVLFAGAAAVFFFALFSGITILLWDFVDNERIEPIANVLFSLTTWPLPLFKRLFPSGDGTSSPSLLALVLSWLCVLLSYGIVIYLILMWRDKHHTSHRGVNCKSCVRPSSGGGSGP